MVGKNKVQRDRLVALLLVGITLAVFWQVQDHEFLNYDDGLYVTENRHVQKGLSLESVMWALTTNEACNWQPLTWLSHMLDCELYGLNPAGHHLTNLLLHVTNTLLLFLIFKRMTGALWQSAFVGALFALHPLHVESVAWVAERKDLLSTFFWMVTTGFYLQYIESPGLHKYLLALLSFALGLMVKPMVVTLPFVLLLLDYWPLSRFQVGQQRIPVNSETTQSMRLPYQRCSILCLVWEKVPFFALSGASCVLTFVVQQSGGAVNSLDMLPLEIRFANAILSYADYIWKMVWPHHLAVFYPHPGYSLQMWQAAGAGLFLLAVSGLVILRIRRYPYLLVGWLWYLGTLIPVIGLVQVGSHAMADRYTYVPLIGLFIIIAWGLNDIFIKWLHQRIVLVSLSGIVVSMLTVCSWTQVQHWQNSLTLFRHTLSVTTQNWLAHNNLGLALAERGEMSKAINHYEESIRIWPNNAEAYNNLGIALASQGKAKEGIVQFRKAIQIEPDFAYAHYNLGVILSQEGKLSDAVWHYRQALRTKPDDAETHNNLGIVLTKQHKISEAICHFRNTLKIRPNDSKAHDNLRIALNLQENLP